MERPANFGETESGTTSLIVMGRDGHAYDPGVDTQWALLPFATLDNSPTDISPPLPYREKCKLLQNQISELYYKLRFLRTVHVECVMASYEQ